MRRVFFLALMTMFAFCARAQYNIEKMLSSAEIALHYEDYPLAIAYNNHILALRPYLFKPWQLRGAAKLFLEDYSGSEEDATEALRLNPYIDGLYDLRAISRIYQQNWQGAIDDYTKGLEVNPSSKEFWYNRALCEYNRKNLDVAREQVDTINRRWSQFVNAYTLKAEILLQQKDTIGALSCISKGLELNPYDSGIWYSKAMVCFAKEDWKEAGLCFSKVLHLKPKHIPSLICQALCYAQLGEVATAKSKYSLAIEFDPNNFIAHYNRGIINAHLGRYEEALIDFNYVLSVEPRNAFALKNKELLMSRGKKSTSKGQWTLADILVLRSRGDNKNGCYSSLIVESREEQLYNLEFITEYRGQRRSSSINDGRSVFMLSYVPYSNGSQSYLAFDKDVEKFIAQGELVHNIYVTCGQQNVSPSVMRETFEVIDSLTARIDAFFEGSELERLYMQRAVAYSVVQNYSDAISDLNWVITLNPSSMIAYWQRAICQTLLNGFNIAQGLDVKVKSAVAMDDINKALELAGNNAYLYYNRAFIHAQNQEIGLAIEDYSQAIRIEPNMAEAYYNRGILYIKLEDPKSAASDLKKAGEFGIKEAYGVLNRIGVVR